MQAGSIGGNTVEGQAGDAPQPRLVRAAHEFEGQMMQELLKPMTGGNALTGAEDDDSGSGGALGEFASQGLGQELSQRGGFGIADKIVNELSHSRHQHSDGKVTGNLHGNTVMRTSE